MSAGSAVIKGQIELNFTLRDEFHTLDLRFSINFFHLVRYNIPKTNCLFKETNRLSSYVHRIIRMWFQSFFCLLLRRNQRF